MTLTSSTIAAVAANPLRRLFAEEMPRATKFHRDRGFASWALAPHTTTPSTIDALADRREGNETAKATDEDPRLLNSYRQHHSTGW